MNIYYETDYGDELWHAGNGNGIRQRKNHKYIARVREGTRYRYFYSQAEIAAYNAAKKVGGAVGGAARAAGNALANTDIGRKIGIGLESKMARQKEDYERKDDLYNMAVKKWQHDTENDRKIASARKYAGDADDAATAYNETLATYNKSLIKKAKDTKNEVSKAVGTKQRAKMEEARKELSNTLSMRPDRRTRNDIRERGGPAREAYRDTKARSVAEAKAKYEYFKRLYADTPLGKIENAAKFIKKGASQVARSISKAGSQTISAITSGGSKFLNAGKSLLSGLLGKKKK